MRSLADDRFDPQLGVVLPVPLMLLIMLAPAHLEDPDLLAAAVRDDRRLDRRTRDDRLAEANAFAVAHHQHLIQNHFRAHVRRYRFYLEFFAGGNLVLLAAGFYDRVHEWNSCCWRWWKPMPCRPVCREAERLVGAARDRASRSGRGKPWIITSFVGTGQAHRRCANIERTRPGCGEEPEMKSGRMPATPPPDGLRGVTPRLLHPPCPQKTIAAARS